MLYVLVTFSRNVSSSGFNPGAGIAARWTTASAPLSASTASPYSVTSATSCSHGRSGSRTRSTLRTSRPSSTSSRTTARPALPAPPVTTILPIRPDSTIRPFPAGADVHRGFENGHHLSLGALRRVVPRDERRLVDHLGQGRQRAPKRTEVRGLRVSWKVDGRDERS